MTIEESKAFVGKYMESAKIDYLLDVCLSEATKDNLYVRYLCLYGIRDHMGVYVHFDIDMRENVWKAEKRHLLITDYLKDYVGPYYRKKYAEYVTENSSSIYTVMKFIPQINIIASHHECFINGMKEVDIWTSIIGNYPIVNSPDYKETVNDVVTKSKFKIELRREYGNTTPNTFDFIIATIPIKFVNKTHDEMLNSVIKFRKDLDEMVIHNISEDKRFQKCGVPVNFLKCTNLVLTRYHELVYTFELKGGNKNEQKD